MARTLQKYPLLIIDVVSKASLDQPQQLFCLDLFIVHMFRNFSSPLMAPTLLSLEHWLSSNVEKVFLVGRILKCIKNEDYGQYFPLKHLRRK